MTTAALWIQSARPKTLLVAFAPILMGTALALKEGHFDLLVFLMTLIAGLSIQIGANFASNYFDFVKGADNKERKGPKRVLVDGLMQKETMLKGIIAIFSITILATSYLIWVGGPLILLILALSIAGALLYTGGPFSFADLGIGDYVTLIFFGPVALGITYFLQTKQLSILPFALGLSPGLFSSAVLCVNNLRDIEEDRKVNRKTIPVRLGLKVGELLYLSELCVAISFPALLCKHYVLLALAIPALSLFRKVKKRENLNQLMAQTAQLELILASLFSLCLFF